MSNGWEDLYGDVGGGKDDVQSVVQEQEQEADLTPAQRRQRARDAKRVKRTVEFTWYPELLELVERVMEIESSGISTTVLWLLAEGLRVYQEGKRPRKEIADSLKFSYDLVPNVEELER
jgi:hypothetical protein